MPNQNQPIKFSLKANEFDFIFSYQLADKPQLKKLIKIKEALIATPPPFSLTSLILERDALSVKPPAKVMARCTVIPSR